MKQLKLIIVGILLFAAGVSTADEGMWLPSLIHKLNINDINKKGCTLSAEDIYSINKSSLKDAVVIFGGGCTAELVSGEGLLLTNHHCGFGQIQSHSTVEHDYLNDGFWAKTRDQELPNPGLTVTFLVRVDEVTDKVLAEVTDKMTDKERASKIAEVSGKLEKEAKGTTNYNVYVRSFFENNKYYLFVTETYSDVRLVGTPPQALGKFGGDTDNWMWPRHTNDFSMFRVYSAPDGKPATYSKDNVPYKPKHFFPISLKGVEPGDYSMVMGYPGRTNRYKTSYFIDNMMTVTNPVRIQVREEKLRIIGDYMATSQKARIQYASKHAGSSNYYKYSIGQNQGLKNLNVMAKKKAFETQFTNWVNADNARKEKYGNALKNIEASYADVEGSKAQNFFAEALIQGAEVFMYANRIRPLVDLLADPEKNKDQIARVTSGLKQSSERFYKDFDAATDEKLAGSLMEMFYKNNDPKYHPAFFAEIQKKFKGDFKKYVQKAYASSLFKSQEELVKFLDNPSLKVLKKDMVYKIGTEIMDNYLKIGDQVSKGRENLDKGNRLFLAGMMEMQNDKTFYPDANSTMRLTYGTVMDYEPRDGVIYKHYTTTDGYLQKEIPGDDEFNVPARMKELLLAKDYGQYADKDGKLHSCFISNNDITGGNSGSPVLNGKGELIGIAFDGNWEAMSGDVAFEPELQRCINVDIRFVLWVIDRYAGATNLINEMKIVK